MSRILGVDLGSRRIGVAMSDPTGTVAFPLDIVPHRSLRHDLDRLASLCRTHQVGGIVVGWPRNMDGTSGPAARRAEAFVRALRRAVVAPVELWDERLTTAQAERALITGNVRREKRREVRDQVAAALMLQAYLDARTRRLVTAPQGHNGGGSGVDRTQRLRAE